MSLLIKKFLFLTLIINHVFASETMLFIDTNNNIDEIRIAKSEAKKLGKSLIVFPDPSKKEEFDLSRIEDLLETTPFETLIISGHNGSDQFSADSQLDNNLKLSLVRDAIAKNDFATHNTTTLMLLGCNTANQHKIMKWLNTFPNLNILAGYDGTAPRGYREAAKSYIRELINKKDSLYMNASQKDLKRQLQSIENIWNLQASIYVKNRDCSENSEDYDEFIFRPLLKDTKRRFKLYDTSECREIRNKDYPLMEAKFYKYLSGELKHNESELLALNTFIRSNEHCFQTDNTRTFIGGDQTLALRFPKQVQHNITEYYYDDLENLFEILDQYGSGKSEELREIKLSDLQIQKENITNSLSLLGSDTKFFEKLKKDAKAQTAIVESLRERHQGEQEIRNQLKASLEEDYDNIEIKNAIYSVINSSNYFSEIRFTQHLLKIPGVSFDNVTELVNKIKVKYITPYKDSISRSRDTEREFTLKVSELKNTTSLIKIIEEPTLLKELKEAYNDELTYLDEQSKDLKSLPISQLQDSFKRLKPKNIEDFRSLDRKEISDFAHNLTGVINNSEGMLHQSDKKQLEYINNGIIQAVSFNLSDNLIPYAWHDVKSYTDEPEDSDKESVYVPKYNKVNLSTLKEVNEKTKSTKPLDTFSQIMRNQHFTADIHKEHTTILHSQEGIYELLVSENPTHNISFLQTAQDSEDSSDIDNFLEFNSSPYDETTWSYEPEVD